MDFLDQLQVLSARISKQISLINTEEATKNAFVMPFIQALGYDIFDPTEVIPEFTADVGSKKGEKVDYAIMTDGKPTILVECKCCDSKLTDVHAGQLRRYFHVTDARIGVLTNGCKYMFFSDLEEKNIMDDKPFMEIDLLDIDEQLISELKRLSKSTFELDKMLSTANTLKYTREIKNYLESQINAPSHDFVKLILSEVYTGLKTQQVIEQFAPIVKKSLNGVINDHIKNRLNTALSDQSIEENEGDHLTDESDITQQEVDDRGIITTEEELEGFMVVKAILREVLDVDRIHHRDTKSYFGILLDDNNRKPICRLHFNTSQKYLGVFGSEKKETKHSIDSLNDLYNFSNEIKAALDIYREEDGQVEA